MPRRLPRHTHHRRIDGENAGDQFGWVSNNVGDIDNDGINDRVLTAPTNYAGGSNAGRIYIHSGATGEELLRMTGLVPGARLENDAGAAGDFNMDGTPDIIAGAPNAGPGSVIIFAGFDGSALHAFNGQADFDQFGFRVWGGGDVNGDGDGIGDGIIGAPGHDGAGNGAGRAYVYSGRTAELICAIDGPSPAASFGSGVAFVGDVNHDTRTDVVVGAQNEARSFVYAYDGQACNLLYDLAPNGPSANFGLWFMNGGGDVDGDQRADLLLAAWSADIGANNAGKAFVYSGRTGTILESFTHDGPGATLGFDANGMGDVNRDGRQDYLITAAWNASQTGRAFVFSSTTNPTIIAPTPTAIRFNHQYRAGAARTSLPPSEFASRPSLIPRTLCLTPPLSTPRPSTRARASSRLLTDHPARY